jgi:AraC family transcriptional regulator
VRTRTRQTYGERILRVLLHIQNHLDESLVLEDLARIACFSPYHFHRIFRGMVGESVMEHVRRLRLERAALRLVHTDQQVTRLAFEAGYETLEAFTRKFRATFGLSPTEFRQKHRLVPFPDVPSQVHFDPDGRIETFEPMKPGARKMDVRVEQIEPQRVAFMRHIGPYHGVGETWGKLCAWAGRRNLFGPNTKAIGVCYDDPEFTPPEKIRYDACFVVDESVQPEGEVGVQTLEGGEYAVLTHNGPYEKLAETYMRFCGEWLATSGRELKSAPSLEVYLNSPQDTAPEELVTLIHMPLEPKS